MTPSCRRCGSRRHQAVLLHLERGLAVLGAARAAGMSPASAYRHYKACPQFAAAWNAALLCGQRRFDGRRGRGSQLLRSKKPLLLALAADGVTRAEAARRAGINPATERSWFRHDAVYKQEMQAALAHSAPEQH